MYCEECSQGWTRVGAGYNRCECVRELIVNNIFKDSEAPDKYFKFKEELEDQKSFNILKEEQNYLDILHSFTSEEAIKELIEKEVTITLKGNPGSGKTQLAVTAALEIAKNFDLHKKELYLKKFYFLNMASFETEVFRDEDRKEIVKKVQESDILIIDDLGTENYNRAWALSRLSELLREFKGVKFITTNLAKTDIHTFYKTKDKRLTDVLVNSKEENHGKTNNLFYLIGKRESRRVRDLKPGMFL